MLKHALYVGGKDCILVPFPVAHGTNQLTNPVAFRVGAWRYVYTRALIMNHVPLSRVSVFLSGGLVLPERSFAC